MGAAPNISTLHIAPLPEPGVVVPMLSAEERLFLDLLADIVVSDILQATQQHEEGNRVHQAEW